MIILNTEAMAKVAPAISYDNEGEVLCGIHIFDQDGNRFYEATDGHIAIRTKTAIPENSDPIADMVILGFEDKTVKCWAKEKTNTAFQIKDGDLMKDDKVVALVSKLSYPNTDSIFSNYEKTPPATQFACFDPKLITKMMKVLDFKYSYSRPLMYGPACPAFWENENTVVAVMPYMFNG